MALPEIISIGYAAYHTMVTTERASVWGNTSRGVFIATQDGRILFLTPEKDHGPLTVHLNCEDNRLKFVSANTPVLLGTNQLTIPSAKLLYKFENPVIWEPAMPSGVTIYHADLIRRLTDLSQALRLVKPAAGLIDLLPVDNVNQIEGSNQEIFPGWRKFSNLMDAHNPLATALTHQSPVEMTNYLSELLGVGPGLTPSGDDFILGVLLTLNRWKYTNWDENGIKELNRRILASARDKTTSLSVCLSQCATEGQADERLLKPIDYLFTGQGNPVQQINNLLNWGSSSGVDTLAGISVVVLAVNPKNRFLAK